MLALVTPATVPVTTHAGEWLEAHVDSGAPVRRHAELGDGLLPWAIGLFVLSAVVWWAARRTVTGQKGAAPTPTRWTSAPVRIAEGILSSRLATGAVVDVYRTGDSGAKAAWHDSFSETAQSQEH